MKTTTQLESITHLSSRFMLAFLVLSALLISATPAAAGVTEEWVARYNGPGNSDDVARAMAVDKDGNVYVTGWSYGSRTFSDYATIKYDPNGNQLWVARYNGPGNSSDAASAIAVDKDGNVYVTGASYGSGTYYDYATVKYDPNGHELWVARYNGPGNFEDLARAMAVDASGNVYVTGWSYGSGTLSDYATIKYDPNGNALWVARYDGPPSDPDDIASDYDAATAIAVDASGNVYVTGGSTDSGVAFHSDYATVKYDPNGHELWVARYNGPGNSSDDYAHALAVDASGNVYVTGGASSGYLPLDYATIKYDQNGNELWVARYDGPPSDPDDVASDYDVASAIAVDASDNVYVTGTSGTSHGYDFATIKYDPHGNELWVARYYSLDAYVPVIALDGNGNVYVTGGDGYSYDNHDYVTIKYKQTTDFAGLTQLLNSLLADGAIAAELRTSLLAKVENAKTSYDQGDVCVAVNQLNALKNQIAAQSGKKISNEAADRLLAYINDLATQLLSTLPAGGSC